MEKNKNVIAIEMFDDKTINEIHELAEPLFKYFEKKKINNYQVMSYFLSNFLSVAEKCKMPKSFLENIIFTMYDDTPEN